MSVSSQLGQLQRIDLPEGPIEYRERGAGAPVVFLHGIVANGDLWRNVVGHLGDRFRCITPDWPLGGHRLAMRPDTDFSLFGLARLVDRFLEALDLTGVTLVANDTGGAIAQCVAAYHPDRLEALVLTPCDAFDNFLPPPVRHLQLTARNRAGVWLLGQALRFRPVQRLPIAFGRLTERPIPADIMESYTAPLRRYATTRRDFATLVRAISRRFTEEAARDLAGFTKPALIIWALERRRFFPVEHAHRLAARLPNARVELIEDSGPFVTEDQPVKVASLIASFVSAPTDG
ncbi:MAG TPA: alpha/beta hydrolase [Acidimicrobiales bacterium]|nr:alpha/beta hydrolase [Acidimicrobiales bacterium]